MPAREQDLRNVAFERADAQDCRFPNGRFDLAISKFGTMFSEDPAAAFANIRRALRLGRRLVMVVWQARERNEWDVASANSSEQAKDQWPPFPGERIRSRSPTRRP